MNKLLQDESKSRLFLFIYENLDIIDSKSSSLLTYNSLIIAGIALLLNFKIVGSLMMWLFFLAILVFVVSSVICLRIVYVRWTSNEDFNNEQEHLMELLKLRDRRTVALRIGWLFSFLGSLYFLLLLILSAVIAS